MRLTDWVRRRVTDYTPGVGRVFIVCRQCHRVVPYYTVYGPASRAQMGCPSCGHDTYKPAMIPEWQAAWLLVWSWVTRQGDPRMPVRSADSRYA